MSDFKKTAQMLLLFLGSCFSIAIYSDTSTALLTDPQNENAFLCIVKSGELTFTKEYGQATPFTLHNITNTPMGTGLGVTNYLITAPDGRYLNVNGQELVLKPFNDKESLWFSVIHYQYWNQLKNQGYQLNKIMPLEK